MKAKDQIQGENKALKQQLAKTAEVITKIQEAEKSLILKMVSIIILAHFLMCVGIAGTPACIDGNYSNDTGKEVTRKFEKGERFSIVMRVCKFSDYRCTVPVSSEMLTS